MCVGTYVPCKLSIMENLLLNLMNLMYFWLMNLVGALPKTRIRRKVASFLFQNTSWWLFCFSFKFSCPSWQSWHLESSRDLSRILRYFFFRHYSSFSCPHFLFICNYMYVCLKPCTPLNSKCNKIRYLTRVISLMLRVFQYDKWIILNVDH